MWSRFVPDMGESDFLLVAEFCEFTDDALRDLVVIVCACGAVLVQPTCFLPLPFIGFFSFVLSTASVVLLLRGATALAEPGATLVAEDCFCVVGAWGFPQKC